MSARELVGKLLTANQPASMTGEEFERLTAEGKIVVVNGRFDWSEEYKAEMAAERAIRGRLAVEKAEQARDETGTADGAVVAPSTSCPGHEAIDIKGRPLQRGASWRGKLAVAFMVAYMVAALAIEYCRGAMR